jgi:opacity protein-like surface antigen
MKYALTIALAITSLATTAHAVIVGLETGYLTDNQDAYYSARLGGEWKASDALSHQAEIELGYTKHSERSSFGFSIGNSETKIKPLTLNYRLAVTRTEKLGYYFGAGAGMAWVDLGFPGSGLPWISASDEVLTLQCFGGITYQPTPGAALHLGLKYLWLGDFKDRGISAEVGDDLAVTAGVSFRF